MNSYNALDPPIWDETVGDTYTFYIPYSAYDPSITDFDFMGIELYYRIFVGTLPSGIDSLTFTTQLSSFGFKRLYKAGETKDNADTNTIAKPLLNIESYKTTPDHIEFRCTFDSNVGTLTVTYYDNNGDPFVPSETFELRRAVYFPDYPVYNDKQYAFKGFDDFLEVDRTDDGSAENGDIVDDIWKDISAEPTVNVNLVLYAFSYGISLAANNPGGIIESRLTYLSYLSVTCYPYDPNK
jgi:hypothetical protein